MRYYDALINDILYLQIAVNKTVPKLSSNVPTVIVLRSGGSATEITTARMDLMNATARY